MPIKFTLSVLSLLLATAVAEAAPRFDCEGALRSLTHRGLVTERREEGPGRYRLEDAAVRKHFGAVSKLIPSGTVINFNAELAGTGVHAAIHAWHGHLELTEAFLEGEAHAGHELVLVHELVHLDFFNQRRDLQNWDTAYRVRAADPSFWRGYDEEIRDYGRSWSWEEVYAFLVPMLIRLDSTCGADTPEELAAHMEYQIDDLETARRMLEVQRNEISRRLVAPLAGTGIREVRSVPGFEIETLSFGMAQITRTTPAGMSRGPLELSSFKRVYAEQAKGFDALAAAMKSLGSAAELTTELRSADRDRRAVALKNVCGMRDAAWAAVDLAGVKLSRFRHSLD